LLGLTPAYELTSRWNRPSKETLLLEVPFKKCLTVVGTRYLKNGTPKCCGLTGTTS
jgi:hypothetical protein